MATTIMISCLDDQTAQRIMSFIEDVLYTELDNHVDDSVLRSNGVESFDVDYQTRVIEVHNTTKES